MRPAYRLRVNSADLPVSPLSIEVAYKLASDSDSPSVALPVRDPTGQPVRHPRHGFDITAALGFEARPLENFGGFVVSTIGPPAGPADMITVTVVAPELQGAIKALRTDSWHEITLEDLLPASCSRAA